MKNIFNKIDRLVEYLYENEIVSFNEVIFLDKDVTLYMYTNPGDNCEVYIIEFENTTNNELNLKIYCLFTNNEKHYYVEQADHAYTDINDLVSSLSKYVNFFKTYKDNIIKHVDDLLIDLI